MFTIGTVENHEKPWVPMSTTRTYKTWLQDLYFLVVIPDDVSFKQLGITRGKKEGYTAPGDIGTNINQGSGFMLLGSAMSPNIRFMKEV